MGCDNTIYSHERFRYIACYTVFIIFSLNISFDGGIILLPPTAMLYRCINIISTGRLSMYKLIQIVISLLGISEYNSTNIGAIKMCSYVCSCRTYLCVFAWKKN